MAWGKVRACITFWCNTLFLLLVLVILPCTTATPTLANDTTTTTSQYGTMTVNSSALATPWPISAGFLAVSFLIGLPGFLDTAGRPLTLGEKVPAAKEHLQIIMMIVTIVRCSACGISAIRAIASPPPYPRLSDSIYVLGFTSMLYWDRVAPKRQTILMLCLNASLAFLGGPNLYLGVRESVQASSWTCLYTFTPIENCLSQDLCDHIIGFVSNFSCAAWPPKPEYVCSRGEVVKGWFGMLGAFAVTLGAVVMAGRNWSVLVESKPPVGVPSARLTFIISILVGIASLAISYWGTTNATSVSIGDCRHYKVNTIDNCGSCVSMLSPSSKDGYLSTWVGDMGYNWLNIVALS